MNIKNVVESQKRIYNILYQAKKNNRLSHAYLFYGDKGTGKKEMAYQLACMLYCDKGGCLECETCKTILDNNHMNVDYIGISDEATKISKDQIIDLQDEFSKTSLVDGVRVYIVDGIDTASNQAQNSLLKFIEDPVNQTPTIGIFLATEISNVVSTIRSRCGLFHFEAIPRSNMVDMLIENGIDELDSILASGLTNDVDEAIEIAKTEEFYNTKEKFLELITLKNKKNTVVFYVNNVNYFMNSNNLTMLLKWVLDFHLDCNLEKKDKDNLILSPLCDKIEAYKSNVKGDMRSRLSDTLSLFDKLKNNITPKNIFFELMEKFI